MSRIRIVFLGTPEFAVCSLRALIEDPHFEIVGVISQPDRPSGRRMQLNASPVTALALEKGLRVFTPATVNTEEFRQHVIALGAEAGVVVAFGQILGQKFLDLFPHGCVNIHGSLLPRWRGAAPIQRSLMAGDVEGGVALQIVVRKLDAGPVLGIRRTTLSTDLDAQTLHDRLMVLGAELLHLEFMDYLRGHLLPLAQDESLVTIAPKIEKSEAKIDWNRTAIEIHNQVRGLAMGPFAYTTRDQQSLKIHKTRVVTLPNSVSAEPPQPGEVTRVDGSSFCIACRHGAIEVLEVQPESRARQNVEQYLRGYPLRPGERFS